MSKKEKIISLLDDIKDERLLALIYEIIIRIKK